MNTCSNFVSSKCIRISIEAKCISSKKKAFGFASSCKDQSAPNVVNICAANFSDGSRCALTSLLVNMSRNPKNNLDGHISLSHVLFSISTGQFPNSGERIALSLNLRSLWSVSKSTASMFISVLKF